MTGLEQPTVRIFSCLDPLPSVVCFRYWFGPGALVLLMQETRCPTTMMEKLFDIVDSVWNGGQGSLSCHADGHGLMPLRSALCLSSSDLSLLRYPL